MCGKAGSSRQAFDGQWCLPCCRVWRSPPAVHIRQSRRPRRRQHRKPRRRALTSWRGPRGGERLRDTIETRDGPVARLIRKDGRALTSEEDQAERDRLQSLLSSPSAFARHQKDEDEGKKLAMDLIRLLPDAMQYTYAPGQPQTSDAVGPQVVIDYAPKPGWNPPRLRGAEGASRESMDRRSQPVRGAHGR